MNEIGLRIKNSRDRLGLSQAQLGDLCSVSQTNIHQFEKGKRELSTTILRLADALNVDPFWIETGTARNMRTLSDEELEIIDLQLKRLENIENIDL